MSEHDYVARYNERIRQRLIKLREQSGMSISKLARSCTPPLNLSYISRLESGDTKPRMDAIERILAVHGVAIEDFLRNSDLPDRDSRLLTKLAQRISSLDERTKRIIECALD
jgi:transcriptional regulator with XRE-family HTH domain